MVVTGQHQRAAQAAGACEIRVPEDVATAIDAGTLAVPNARHAIGASLAHGVQNLRAINRRGAEILIDGGPMVDVVFL